jgi:hypothetical protein
MTDEQLILTVERLRDDLQELKSELKTRYQSPSLQVTARDVRSTAARLAEMWMVALAQRPEIVKTIPTDYRADLAVHFQRLLTFSEHASKRSRYESEIKAILEKFTLELIIPLKRLRTLNEAGTVGPQGEQSPVQVLSPPKTGPDSFVSTAFVGHSFLPSDEAVFKCIVQTLEAIGIHVATGEKPRAERISEKVKKLIEAQYLFVGVFTRRDKIARKNEWTTSAWIIDEKAYAVGKNKKLILFKEDGVGSIGGLQGDYEYIDFSRETLQIALVKLLEMFELSTIAVRS